MPAHALSFIGCDKAPGEVRAGEPHRGWHICKTELPIKDVRGRGAQFATKVAISGSHEYVILKTVGAQREVLARAEKVLRSLAADGYSQVGLVVADGQEPTILELFTGGRPGRYAST